jgi:GGDEF domain-containing protein
MAPYILALHLVIVVQLLIIVALALLVRYFAISPSFGIAGQAAGRLKVWLTFGPRIWIAGDIDSLGDVNDVLGTPEKPGEDRWNELMTWVLRQLRADDTALIYGGDEFRWGLRLDDTRYGRRRIDPARWRVSARGFCERVQAVLRSAPYSDEERSKLLKRTGKPYVTITLAGAYSPGWRSHRKAIRAALARVKQAKPKDSRGQRGEILEACL